MSRARPTPRFPAALASVGAQPAGAAGSRPLLRPQRPVAEAARQAVASAAPAGLGLDSASVRARMVARLRAGGISCEPVLDAFARVERHRFIDSALATQAYEDTSLPIGHAQTISKPSVVARMLALLFDSDAARASGSLGRVLEVGTGCGYQAALLSLLSDAVVSIERLRPLHEKARVHLHGWRAGDVRLVHADGHAGHAPWAPYQHIIAAAGGEALPDAWREQLAIGGRLVAPVHDARERSQVLLVLDRTPDGWREQRLEAVHFVPLKSGRA